jgi:hypothetical protein
MRGLAVKGGWMSVAGETDLMGLLPKSAVMVSHRPPLLCSMRVTKAAP